MSFPNQTISLLDLVLLHSVNDGRLDHEMQCCPGKGILARDTYVALLIDRTINHHQLQFAWCMESTRYHGGGAVISICFLDATVH